MRNRGVARCCALALAMVMVSGCSFSAVQSENPSMSAPPSAQTGAANPSVPATTASADASGSSTAPSTGDPKPGTPVVWEETDRIRVNQVGYKPGSRKQVIVEGEGTIFHLVPKDGGPTALIEKLEGPLRDSVTGDTVYMADFSAFDRPGDYRVVVEGVGGSFPFRIAEDAYDALDQAALKFFFFQRCGMALEASYAEPWTHAACHLKDGALFENEAMLRAATGGWHDAGDYGRYTVNTSVALADLLLSWDFFPNAFSDGTGIPESGNGIPDVLDEARYALDWLLRMQEASTGGVYHKLTTVNFSSLTIMPEHDLLQLYFSPMSTTATADFAAVMALAARVFEPVDEPFSQTCLAAARKAWSWLEAFEGEPGFTNPKGMLTGEYGDRDDRDERFWAAAELYRTTAEPIFGEKTRLAFAAGGMSFTGLDWQEVSGFGSLAYVFAAHAEKDPVVADGLTDTLLVEADEALRRIQSDTYGSSLTASDYGWGSNAAVLNDAMRLMVANRLQPNPALVEAADACRQYLLGRNVLSQCYFTGFGTRTVRQPHHRPTLADRVMAPVPGMVAGGPNSALEDPAVKAACEGQPPAACYVDDVSSYSTNEIAINWNAPAVFVFAGLRASE